MLAIDILLSQAQILTTLYSIKNFAKVLVFKIVLWQSGNGTKTFRC